MGKEKEHHYTATVTWTGNKGEGTANYKAFARDHIIQVEGKPPIPGSSDPSFRGAPDRYNPEDLLVSSLSACHMLWYLHCCAVNKVVVTDYRDEPEGTMVENADGSGHFTGIDLRPRITLAEASMLHRAEELHEAANKFCYLAASVNFPVTHHPVFVIAE